MSIRSNKLCEVIAFLKHPLVAGITVGVGTLFVILLLSGPAKCRDGWASTSIGVQGACSHHGGIDGSAAALAMMGALVAGLSIGIWLHTKAEKEQAEQRKIDAEKRKDEVAEIKARAIADGIACPQCGFPMQRRVAHKGKNRGKYFMGCLTYPICRGARDLSDDERAKWGEKPIPLAGRIS